MHSTVYTTRRTELAIRDCLAYCFFMGYLSPSDLWNGGIHRNADGVYELRILAGE